MPATSVVNRTECPVCKSQSIAPALTARDHTVSQETFSIWHCATCACRFTQSVPDESEIGAYYQAESYISHSNTRKGLLARTYQIARRYTLGRKRQQVISLSGRQAGTLLDVGCGTGEFLAAMQAGGWTVSGYEPDPGARTYALEQNKVSVSAPEGIMTHPAHSADVITLWHVLEHVHQLDAYLAALHRILKTDGVLLIAVPNYTSWDGEHYQGYWAAYDVPRHLYHFSPAGLTSLMASAGFTLSQMLPLPLDAYYVSLLSEKYQHGRFRPIQSMISGIRSSWAAQAGPDRCSSVLYVLKKTSA
ncbi:MAG: class I SAM-dependent methyltransferase [Bacteroidia bacterium]|nr:class I SAM-dependent methyltransferase [Bacteroidia bacterium]